jgi:hypothetical protein
MNKCVIASLVFATVLSGCAAYGPAYPAAYGSAAPYYAAGAPVMVAPPAYYGFGVPALGFGWGAPRFHGYAGHFGGYWHGRRG